MTRANQDKMNNSVILISVYVILGKSHQ